MSELHIGIDTASGTSIAVTDKWMAASSEYPHGSWMHMLGEEVLIATGHYAALHPGEPSPYKHHGPPFAWMRIEITARV